MSETEPFRSSLFSRSDSWTELAEEIATVTVSPKTVGVLHGGASTEREVSFLTSDYVVPTLEGLGHDVVLCDPAVDSLLEMSKTEVVFNCLHGSFGEDGQVQGFLTALGVPYTGSGVTASAVGMDKLLFKRFARSSGIQVPEEIPVTGPHSFPIVAKHRSGGGSIGLAMVRNNNELAEYLDSADHRDVLLEPFLEGALITVGAIELWGRLVFLPAIEIGLGDRPLYDFESKYNKGQATLNDAVLSEPVVEQILRAIESLWRDLSIRSYARFDFISTSEGPVLLELNTLPGLQRGSNFVTAAEVAGVDFPSLVTLLLSNATI